MPVAGQWAVLIPFSQIGEPTSVHENEVRVEDLIENFLHPSCEGNVTQVSLSDVLLFAEKLDTVSIILGEWGNLKEVSARNESFAATSTFYADQ